MTHATARPRSLRLRLIALFSAIGIGLALLPAGVALADEPTIEGNISGTITGSDTSTGIQANLVWTETTTAAVISHPTTPEGWYSADLPYGTYTVVVSSTGYQSANQGPFTLTVADPHVDLNLALDPVPVVHEGNISGTITGSDTSTGIQANLVWTETTTAATFSHPTTPEGWYSADLPYGTYTVVISSTGYLSANQGPFTLTVADPDSTLNLALDPDAPVIEGTIYGTITGSDTGSGIPATLVFTETTTAETHTGPTLADGWYYANTLSYGTWTVSISSPGYQTIDLGPFALTVADPEYNLDVALDPDAVDTLGSISGAVTASDTGAGTQTFLVFTNTSTLDVYNLMSNADGSFSIDLPYGSYDLAASRPGYQTVDYGPVTLTDVDPEELLAITLIADGPTATGTVSGTVVDAVTHEPMAGIDISLQGSEFPVSEPATSDLNGAFSFSGLPVGHYSVTGFPWSLPYLIGSVSAEVTVGELDAVVELELTPYASGTATLDGIVTDIETAAPLTGTSLTLEGQDVPFVGHTNSDGSGHYAFTDLAAGTYSLTASAGGYAFFWETITIGDGESASATIALYPLNAALHGRVTDPHGDPVVGLTVSLSGPSIGFDETDANGEFSISGIAAAEHWLQVGGYFTPWVFQSIAVTPVSGTSIEQDIQLVARTGSAVLGWVSDENGQGLEGICVELLDAGTGTVVDSMPTWSDSTFDFDDVVDGEYTLRFEDCDPSRVPQRASAYFGGGSTLEDAATFTIAGPLDDHQFDGQILYPKTPTGSITITVTDEVTGDPISDISGSYYTDGAGWTDFTDAAPGGVFTLSGLAYGSYQVEVEAPGYHSGYSCSCLAIDEDDPDATGSIELDAYDRGTGSLSGTVTASDTGDPVEAELILDGYGDPDFYYTVVADEYGAYEFDDLPAGTFFFQAYIDGYGPEIAYVTVGDGEDVVKDVVLLPADSAVEGIVTDVNDHLLGDVWYELRNSDGFTLMSDATYLDGSFFIGALASGDYTLHLGGPGSGYEEKVVPFTLNGGTTTLPPIVLDAATTAQLDGAILDAAAFDVLAFEGVEGACVALVDDSGAFVGDSVSTDADGFFSLPDIAPGVYRIMFWDCDSTRGFVYATGFMGGPTWDEAYVVELAAGDAGFVGFGFAELGSSMSGNISVSAPGGSVPLPLSRHVQPHLEVFVDDDWVLSPTPLFSVDANGDYVIAGLNPGHYSVVFEDTETGARAYPSVSYFEEVDLPYDATLSGIDVTFQPEKPTDPAVPVSTSGLGGGTKDTITGCATITPGSTCELDLPDGKEGEYVAVFGHSTPVSFGDWKAVDTAGTVTITIPAGFPAGAHKLVVQDANGNVIGWKDVTVPGVVTGTGGTGSGGTSTGGSKSSTGTTVTPEPTPTPTVEPSAEPGPEESEEPSDPAEPVDEADPEAQDAPVDAFPVGWVIGGGLGVLLVIVLIVVLVARARRV